MAKIIEVIYDNGNIIEREMLECDGPDEVDVKEGGLIQFIKRKTNPETNILQRKVDKILILPKDRLFYVQF